MKTILISKLTVLLIFVLGMNYSAKAQAYSQVRVVFSGTVFSNDTHEKIIGAKVYVYQIIPGQSEKLVGGGETDSQGNFYINQYFKETGSIYKNWLAPGIYLLKMRSPAIKAYDQTLFMFPDNLNIKILPA